MYHDGEPTAMEHDQRETTPPVKPLPNEAREQHREEIRAFADWIARLLDSAIQIPGTSIRIGIDPLLGLIPGLGDVIATLMGSMILVLAAQLQVPKIVMVRMAMNVGINAMIGAIPGIGDLFSIWFRSNLRNAELLRHHATRRTTRATPWDWLVVIGVIVGTLAMIVGTFTLIIVGLRTLWHADAF